MPTVYTAEIGKGQTFEDFTQRCAKAIGPLTHMREAPMDAPLQLRQPSEYYSKRICDLREEIQFLEKLTTDEIITQRNKEHEERKAKIEKLHQERETLRREYTKMLAKVLVWEPPSDDHRPLKDFMIEQLRKSISFDCDITPLEEDLQRNPPPSQVWYNNKLTTLKEELTCMEKHQEEELQRVMRTNKWIKTLEKDLQKRRTHHVLLPKRDGETNMGRT